MIHETPRFRLSLRRYSDRAADKCPGKYRYHNAQTAPITVIERPKHAEGHYDVSPIERDLTPPQDDPRWPVRCDHCEYRFDNQDHFQLFTDHIYVDDAGTEYSLRNPVPGMMWFADWMSEDWHGPDGHCLVAVCPNGSEWMIDGRASNCTMPQDRGHRCWVRHGVPPNVTVDKNGKTCAAGAGSIAVPGYHGFLRNGEFT